MKRFIWILTVTASFILIGCPPSLEEAADVTIYDGDAGDVIINNYYYDDDDSATASKPTPGPADETEVLEAYTFFDSWTGVMEIEVGPSTIGYPLHFGSWTTCVYGEPGSAANLSLDFIGMVNGMPWDDGFTAGQNDGFVLSDHVGNCSVRDNWTGMLVWDVQNPSEEGVLNYNDGYPVMIGATGAFCITLNLQCTPVLESLDLGEEVLVSFMVGSGENIVVWNEQQGNQSELLSDNVWPNSTTVWPRLYTRFYRPAETMDVFTAWDSLSGNVSPGWVELGRFVFAPQQMSQINQIVFTVDGWDSDTGWKSCAEAMNSARWYLKRRELDLFTGGTTTYTILAPVHFAALSGTDCSQAPTDTLGYVTWYDMETDIVPSSAVAISYSVEFDAGNVSPWDWIQIGIADPGGFTWTDLQNDIAHNGADGSTTGLPAWGNQLTFIN